jgi:hypothetical protein
LTASSNAICSRQINICKFVFIKNLVYNEYCCLLSCVELERDLDERFLRDQRKDILEGESGLKRTALIISLSLVSLELKNFTFFTIFIQLVS